MSFTDAIRDAFTQYATFSGRSSRAAYWWFALFNALVVVTALVLDAALRTGGVFYLLTALAVIVPNLAVTVRRLHDTGHSAWWLLISIVPLVGPIVLLVITVRGSEGPNKWGYGPDGSGPKPPAFSPPIAAATSSTPPPGRSFSS
jgi:uncharacterized membrane protein YhaH (DUF805 family)